MPAPTPARRSAGPRGRDDDRECRSLDAHLGQESVNISVVVPVKNEVATVEPLIERLAGQSRRPIDVIIVDGGSTDGSLERATSAAQRFDNVRVIDAGDATPGRGRNVGVVEATSEWIAFTDAGIDVDVQWLDRMARVVEAHPAIDVVYGAYEPVIDSPFAEAAALAYVGRKDRTAVGPVRTKSIASCLLRREVWQRVGGFPDLRAAEDLLFMAAVDEEECTMAIAPEALVRWHLQPTLALTFARFRLYSRHNVLAGQAPTWHHAVLRHYSIGALLLVAGLLRPKLLLLPPLGFVARSMKSVWSKREARSVGWVLNPARLLRVCVILATVDFATFVGWADAIRGNRRGRR